MLLGFKDAHHVHRLLLGSSRTSYAEGAAGL